MKTKIMFRHLSEMEFCGACHIFSTQFSTHPLGISPLTLGRRNSSVSSSSACGIGSPPPPVEPSPRAITYETSSVVSLTSSERTHSVVLGWRLQFVAKGTHAAIETALAMDHTQKVIVVYLVIFC